MLRDEPREKLLSALFYMYQNRLYLPSVFWKIYGKRFFISRFRKLCIVALLWGPLNFQLAKLQFLTVILKKSLSMIFIVFVLKRK